MYGSTNLSEEDAKRMNTTVEDPEKLAAFEDRISKGEKIEPGDWMPVEYRRQLIRMIEQHAHSEIVGALPEGTHIMPWRIEDEVRKLGANYIQAGAFRSFAIRDGNLVTGQQNFSGAETARLILEAVGR